MNIVNCIFCGFLLDRQLHSCENFQCSYIFKYYDFCIRIKMCDSLDKIGLHQNNCYDFYIKNPTNILIAKKDIEIFKDYYDYEFTIDEVKKYFFSKEEGFKRNLIFT